MKSISTALYFLIYFGIIDYQNVAGKNIICYYTNWSPYRSGRGRFEPQNIDASLCTDLCYAYVGISDDKLTPLYLEEDIKNGGYKRFNEVKQSNDKLKTTLSIGGTKEVPSKLNNIIGSKVKIDAFITNAIAYLRQHDFDGLNVGWIHPKDKPEDVEGYVTFMKSLREEFGKEAILNKANKSRLILSMSLPSKLPGLERGFNLQKLQNYVEYFNVFSYDYHDKSKVSHPSPLFALQREPNQNEDSTVDGTIRSLLQVGVMRDKINLGIPTFGRTFELKNNENHRIGSPAKEERNTMEKFKGYYDICKMVKDENWTIVQVNMTAAGPYAFRGDDWVAYDDENIARKKGEYARIEGLGGLMFWTIDNDDFNGDCGKGRFPIIKAAKEGFI